MAGSSLSARPTKACRSTDRPPDFQKTAFSSNGPQVGVAAPHSAAPAGPARVTRWSLSWVGEIRSRSCCIELRQDDVLRDGVLTGIKRSHWADRLARPTSRELRLSLPALCRLHQTPVAGPFITIGVFRNGLFGEEPADSVRFSFDAGEIIDPIWPDAALPGPPLVCGTMSTHGLSHIPRRRDPSLRSRG